MATRLRPITKKIPKALVEVAGEPFIAHQLRLLKCRGFSRAIICAWYRGAMIRDFVGDGERFGLNVRYSFDGDYPLGTGGAIKKALPQLGENFFVLYGDSYLPCDYLAVQLEFEYQNKKALMTIFQNFGKWDSSNVEYSAGHIMAYDKVNKTPAMQFIDYGLGVFNRSAFDLRHDEESFDLSEIYQSLLKMNELAGYPVQQRFYEVGSFEGLKELDNLLSKRG